MPSSSPPRAIDRLPAISRQKEMKVLVLGLSRTGTMSIKAALEQFGWRTYHMKEAGQDRANSYWSEAIDAKYYNKGIPYGTPEFEKLLGNYQAISDVPAVMFVDEMLAAYPHAKVVLTNRDVDNWIESVNRTIYVIWGWKSWALLYYFSPKGLGATVMTIRRCVTIWADGDFWNREKLRQGFLDHYEHVRAVVPKNQLLEFRSQDGWEPLCKFLNQDVPAGPYPRVNDSDDLVKTFAGLWRFFVKKAIRKVARYVIPASTLALVIWYLRAAIESLGHPRNLLGNGRTVS